jgi:hypothetical protein
MDRNEHPLKPRHVGVPSVASKIISKPMVRLAQTMDVSCTDTNIVSNWTETRFHMTYASKGFHRVRPKWFLSLWYVWCKSCTCLALTLTLPPIRLRRDSTWPTSPRCSIGCVQNDFWAYGMFGAIRAPVLHWHSHCLQTDWKQDSTRAPAPRSSIGCFQNNFFAYGTFGANYAPILHQD